MPRQSTISEERFLPEALEDRLLGFLARAGGIVLLGATACIWASLLSWSVTDPSLTQSTAGRAANTLGAPGAITADLLLQSFGYAAVFLLLAPMLWAAELIHRQRIENIRGKMACYPFAVVMIAGALSSLPMGEAWPLSHGGGGLAGDVTYGFMVGLFSLLNADRAGAVAGFVLFAIGCSALARCSGLTERDLLAVFSWPRTSRARIAGKPAFWRSLAGQMSVKTPEPQDDTPAYFDDGRREPYFTTSVARVRQAWRERAGLHLGPREQEPAPAVSPEPVPPAAAAAEDLPPDDPFDLQTDMASRAIAERFAPTATARKEADDHPLAVTPEAPAPGTAPRAYRHPSVGLLERAAEGARAGEVTAAALRGRARLLEDVLADFGVKGVIRDIRPGPVVTLFELEPARGTKSSRVIGLADDIARSMSVPAVRVAVVPGRSVIGIELPNLHRATVLLRDVLESQTFAAADAVLPLALGKTISGEPFVVDLARMPHLLVAGTTGSGKSVGVNAMVLSLLYRHSPETCRLLMIDPKMLELSVYNGIPHLLTPVVTDPHKAVAALNWVVAEMEERYKRMSQLAVRNIEAFNTRVETAREKGERITRTVQTGFDRTTGHAIYEKQTLDIAPMPYIVVVVDEFADLMIVAGKEIEAAVQRLAQMARAAGIHLVMATQRPSVDIVTGTIKANFPTRISFKVASKIDSRTILNEQGAEQLLGQGDMLVSSGPGQTVRVHGAFVSDEEVERVARTLCHSSEPQYVAGVTEGAQGSSRERTQASGDDLYDRAVALVLRDAKASISYLQRRLGIGYNRAADLIERMERERLVGPPNGMGKRDILMSGSPAA